MRTCGPRVYRLLRESKETNPRLTRVDRRDERLLEGILRELAISACLRPSFLRAVSERIEQTLSADFTALMYMNTPQACE